MTPTEDIPIANPINRSRHFFRLARAFLLTDRPGLDKKKTSACHGIAKD
jgi:hypothetical protein